MDTRLLTALGVLFLAGGLFTVVRAARRQQQARAQGQPTTTWYKNLSLLTGLEYILLSIIVFLNLSHSLIPSALKPIFDGLYTAFFILTITSFLVVMFIWMRQPRPTSLADAPAGSAQGTTPTRDGNTTLQRKRERRQKAASARRRHAGRS